MYLCRIIIYIYIEYRIAPIIRTPFTKLSSRQYMWTTWSICELYALMYCNSRLCRSSSFCCTFFVSFEPLYRAWNISKETTLCHFYEYNLFGKLWFTSLERHKPFASKKHASGLCRSRDVSHLHACCLQMVYLSLFFWET